MARVVPGEPVDVDLGKPMKGQALITGVVGAVVLVLAVAVAIAAAVYWPWGSERSVDATAHVTVSQVERQPGQSPIAVPVSVVNATEDERDFSVDLAAVSPDGQTVYATAGTWISNVAPGDTGSGAVGFFGAQELPADATFVVTKATGYREGRGLFG